jgi:ferredoxin-NADP reductase
MEQHFVKVIQVSNITHDVLRIQTEKPENYHFLPGQATEVSINKEKWMLEKRPFTFTCLPEDDHLEFSIKTYPKHYGVTNELLQLRKGDELIVREVWGTINYNGEGTFIAGGAGVTPFIAIMRWLRKENKIAGNKLLFANKTKRDIILKDEFEEMLGDNFVNILSEETSFEHEYGQISEAFLKKHITDLGKHVYLCGPEPMMDAIEKQLANIGMDTSLIVKEAF